MKYKQNYKTGQEFCFFWQKEDPFSQWHDSKFVGTSKYGGSQETFYNGEQWMMYNKALLFKDNDIARQILKTKDPSLIKKLGRQVSGFNVPVWDNEKYGIIVKGNKLKFSQNEELMLTLMNTGDRILVEASPYDKVYGIGLKSDHVDALYPNRWQGENLLGKALMDVRKYFSTNSPLLSESSDESDIIDIESSDDDYDDNDIIIIDNNDNSVGYNMLSSSHSGIGNSNNNNPLYNSYTSTYKPLSNSYGNYKSPSNNNNNGYGYKKCNSDNNIKRNRSRTCKLGGCSSKTRGSYEFCSKAHAVIGNKLGRCRTKNCKNTVYYDFIANKKYEHCSKECSKRAKTAHTM